MFLLNEQNVLLYFTAYCLKSKVIFTKEALFFVDDFVMDDIKSIAKETGK